ncbi:TraB/GumN family protein [Asticcacaulis sp. BYS171W]|uniref:TraB/GumN family protein n=1 Tax=Asticcacaulis aquaticus TaxID=2984212 RepID=A0ABT5HP35_9CAUL|nr:TraB/GumN family protein [Asticcacaulis aquaticus]MDC7681807.1 TraB/GumN family protein [Asticcacaulis aquaticus]
MILWRIILLISLLVPSVGRAQEDWSQSETEVVVRGKAGVGPALWRVTDGDSQVIIIGVLPVFPKKQKWTTKRVENALRGANRLITPADTTTGPGDLWSLMSKKGLPDRGTLKDSLPAGLYARYESTARRAGIPIRDFARDKPVWAGARLRREVLQKYGLSESEPLATIKGLARTAGVPVKAAGRYDAGPLFKAVNAMSEEGGEACLSHTLDDIDFDIDRAPVAAKAWSIGDIATVRAHYQGSALMKCLSGSSVATAALNRGVADSVNAVSDALTRPGKSVAVLPLALLLRKGGVLERLRAKGYRVSAPLD